MTRSEVFLNSLVSTEAQARLNALSGSNDNLFESNKWQFENQRGTLITIDFNDLLGMSKRYPDWSLTHTADWVLLTKRIFLSLASGTTPNLYINRVAGLKLLWAAMAYHNLSQVTRGNFSEILEFLLMHAWRKGDASKNLAIKSNGNFNDQIQPTKWKSALSDLGLGWIARDVTDSFVKKRLKKLIPALTDDELTYQDWCQGGKPPIS